MKERLASQAMAIEGRVDRKRAFGRLLYGDRCEFIPIFTLTLVGDAAHSGQAATHLADELRIAIAFAVAIMMMMQLASCELKLHLR